MTEPVSLLRLFSAFFRVGVLGFGGGPSFVPLIEIETVDNYHWLTADQFAEALGFSYALPGPIATKLAGYIGYKTAGVTGAVMALLGLVMPSLIATILILGLAARFRHLPWVEGMNKAIRPVVGVLLLILIWETFTSALSVTGPLVTAGIALAALLALKLLNLHPALVVVAVLLFGALALR